jgi:hypothetical protein
LLKDKIIPKPKTRPKVTPTKQTKPTGTTGTTQPTTTKPTTATTKPTTTNLALSSILSKIDSSGIEFYKPIDNHFRLTKDIITTYNTKLKQQSLVRNRLNGYDTNYNIRATIATSNGQDKQHKWNEMLLSIGGDSELNAITFGFTFAYLDNKLSTTNLPKTNLHSYHGIAYISSNSNNIRLLASGIYSITNYKNEHITGKHTDEFSITVNASQKIILEDFNIDFGVNSQFMGIDLSNYKIKNSRFTKDNQVFLSLGCFIEITTSKQIYNGLRNVGKVSISLHSSYTYIAGIANINNLTVVNTNNNPTPSLLYQPNSHRLHTNLKAQLDYYNWFYSLSVNYHNRKDHDICASNLAVGYKF